MGKSFEIGLLANSQKIQIFWVLFPSRGSVGRLTFGRRVRLAPRARPKTPRSGVREEARAWALHSVSLRTTASIGAPSESALQPSPRREHGHFLLRGTVPCGSAHARVRSRTRVRRSAPEPPPRCEHAHSLLRGALSGPQPRCEHAHFLPAHSRITTHQHITHPRHAPRSTDHKSHTRHHKHITHLTPQHTGNTPGHSVTHPVVR